MLFLVPEAEDSAKTEGTAEEKQFNVELDLDDAPFLEDEAEAAPIEEKSPEPEILEQAAAPVKSSWKDRLTPLLAQKKKLVLAGGVLLLLLVAGIVVNFFLFGGEPDTEPIVQPEVTETAPVEPLRVVVPSAPEVTPAPPAPSFIVPFEPFWVPMKGSEGEVLFLILEFSVPTDEAILQAEINAKKLILRDSVFYFLRNSDFPLHLDNVFADELSEDLISVLNEHLVAGKVQKILFSNFFVEGQ